MAFFAELLANASQRDVHVVIYSGNDDVILPHRGSEVVIQVCAPAFGSHYDDWVEIQRQNTTWGGVQGFSQEPATPWFNDKNEFAGVIHQERNLTYVLFQGAGHEVPR